MFTPLQLAKWKNGKLSLLQLFFLLIKVFWKIVAVVVVDGTDDVVGVSFCTIGIEISEDVSVEVPV